VIPRPPPKKIRGLRREKTPWDIKKSVFKDYVADHEAFLTKCFEFDWSNSKIHKIIKDNQEKELVKQYLRSIYQHLYFFNYLYFLGEKFTNTMQVLILVMEYHQLVKMYSKTLQIVAT